MALRVVRSTCSEGKICPTIYVDPSNPRRAIVQGYDIADPAELAELGLPPGESAVIIDADLIREVLDAAAAQ